MSKEEGRTHDPHKAREEHLRESGEQEEEYHDAPARPERPDDEGPIPEQQEEQLPSSD